MIKQTVSNPSGSTVIIVVLVLIAVTMMGLAAINISTVDINLAANDKFQKRGLYNSDSGFHGTPNVVGQTLDNPSRPPQAATPGDGQCINYLNTLDQGSFNGFLTRQVGAESNCDAPGDATWNDISFRNCNVQADVDICPTKGSQQIGGGAEFDRKADGLGIAGAAYAEFRVTSTGDGADPNSTYTVTGHYVWNDIPGGMN